jgi:hypothetical protein
MQVTIASKYTKQVLWEIQREIKKYTITGSNFKLK